MAGPMVHVVYTDDSGTAYRVRMAALDANLQGGGTAATTQPAMPKGLKTRKRYIRNPTTGHERGITVLSVSNALWTDAVGATVSTVDFSGLSATPPTTATASFILEGRTGERLKAI